MIDISSEQMVPVNQVPAHLPGRTHCSTIWRWVNKGVRGQRLETVMIGGIRYTSLESLQRFVEATTRAANGDAPDDEAPRPRSARQRQKAIKAAETKLAAAGM